MICNTSPIATTFNSFATTIIICALLVMQAKPALPQEGASSKISVLQNIAIVVDTFGKAEMKVSGRAPYAPLSIQDALTPQTTIRTGENSAVLFVLPGGHYLRVGAKSVVLLAQLGKENSYSFKLLSGQVWSSVHKSKQPVKYEVTTPSAAVSCTGTLFGVGYDLESDRSTVSVADGSTSVSLASGGWSGIVRAGQYIPYLRRPQPNIRLRAPEVLSQDAEQKAMWKLLRRESWTAPDLSPKVKPKMNRSTENALQQHLRSAGGIQ